jgi:alpha-mannosidase
VILHMIGNAHLDPVWLWRWPEGCAEAIGTCWAAVDRLEEHGGFIFTRGEARVYRWVEELEPALFSKISAYVREGRWAVVNGWWVQPDCNLPSGEAFLRQALYGQAYFARAFGNLRITTAYNVDSFGHAATLPMLLRHTGYERYVFMRPSPAEKELPSHLFTWRAPDGSEVLAYRIPVAYTTTHYPVSEALAQHQALMERAGHDLMCFYGVGNHGGGPTKENLRTIDEARAQGGALEYSHPERYFDRVEGVERPALADELQFHAIGCYAAVSELKRLNRQAEEGLALAETGAALAAFFTGASYPRERLTSLWQELLFNQFHDILGGTSLRSATDDAVQALGGVVQGAQELLNAAVRRLAAQVEAAPAQPGATFLAFNLTGFEQTFPLEYEPWLEWDRAPYRLVDHRGNELPYQALSPESYMHGTRRLLFRAALPAYGYKLFRLLPGEPQVQPRAELMDTARLETGRWQLELDPLTGGVARLFDKRHQREVFAGTAHAFVVGDPTDTWSHGVDRFGASGAAFACERLEMVEAGPLRTRVRAYARHGASTLVTDYLLYEDEEMPLELRYELDWRERHKLLRLAYPLALERPAFRYEVPYGSLERPADGREVPGQRWVLALDSARGYGVAFANDAKYSYAAQNATFFITAARSPVYAHHDPYPLQESQSYPYIDQGVQRFTLRLLAGSEPEERAAYRLADGLTRAPIITPHVSRGGTWPHARSLLKVTADGCAPLWLKGAEAGDQLLLRLLETRGLRTTGAVAGFAGREEVPPRGLVSLKLDHEGTLTRTDGLER